MCVCVGPHKRATRPIAVVGQSCNDFDREGRKGDTLHSNTLQFIYSTVQYIRTFILQYSTYRMYCTYVLRNIHINQQMYKPLLKITKLIKC